MYTLTRPKRCGQYFWYISTVEKGNMYLRPDLTVQNGTGYSKGSNVGYWDTKEAALKAYNAYYRKYKLKLISCKE